MANPIYKIDFNEMVNYVTGAIDMFGKSKTPSTRQIAEISTNDTGQGGRSGGRGFYRGEGRSGYRGSRGGGSGRGGGGRYRNMARSYSPQEWQALSPEERARVFQARERNRGGGIGGRSQQGGRNPRNLSSIISHEQEEPLNDELSTITSPTTATQATASRTVDNIADRMTRRQRINAIISSVRRIKSSQCRMISSVESFSTCLAELDSHADTCALNETALILEYTDRVVDVKPFSNDYQPLEEIPIVKAALAYDAVTGETFILLFGQALYFGSKIDHIRLNPNQIRMNGVEVDDVPAF